MDVGWKYQKGCQMMFVPFYLMIIIVTSIRTMYLKLMGNPKKYHGKEEKHKIFQFIRKHIESSWTPSQILSLSRHQDFVVRIDTWIRHFFRWKPFFTLLILVIIPQNCFVRCHFELLGYTIGIWIRCNDYGRITIFWYSRLKIKFGIGVLLHG